MSKPIKILAFSGSTRKNSYNKRLLKSATSLLPKNVELTTIDLKDYPLPLYDGDLEIEVGVPEDGRTIRALMTEADGFIITTPEYNSSFSAVLKNTIDWTSRADGDTPSLIGYKGKVAFLLSTSPGKFGGIRSIGTLRSVLENIGVTVIPEHVSIPYAAKVFSETTEVIGEEDLNLIKAGCDHLITLLQ